MVRVLCQEKIGRIFFVCVIIFLFIHLFFLFIFIFFEYSSTNNIVLMEKYEEKNPEFILSNQALSEAM